MLKAVSTPYYRLGKAVVTPGGSVVKAVVSGRVKAGTAWEQVRGIGLIACLRSAVSLKCSTKTRKSTSEFVILLP